MNHPIYVKSMLVKPTHLIINQPTFLQQVRTVLLDRGRFVIGRVRRRTTSQAIELIIDNWVASNVIPNGLDRAPMLDWAAMTTNFDGQTPVERFVEMLRPKRSHLLVAIALDANNHNTIPVLIQDQEQLIKPAQIRFIGSGLLTLPEPINHKPFGIANPLRSSRTQGALGSTFDRIQSMTIILVGAGRGGQELARLLVSIGVRRLIIIDGDVIGPENLDAMPAAGVADIGQWKAIQLANSLHRNQPEMIIQCIPQSIHHHDALRVLRETRADTVFSFVDSNVARLAVSRLCQDTETTHVDLGTLVERTETTRTISADIRLFEPGGQGCVACVPEMTDIEDVLYELAKPADCLHRGRLRTWDEQRAGSLLHLNSLACSIGIESWLSWLEGVSLTSSWTRVRWDAGKLPEIQSTSVGPAESCRFCRPFH